MNALHSLGAFWVRGNLAKDYSDFRITPVKSGFNTVRLSLGAAPLGKV